MLRPTDDGGEGLPELTARESCLVAVALVLVPVLVFAWLIDWIDPSTFPSVIEILRK